MAISNWKEEPCKLCGNNADWNGIICTDCRTNIVKEREEQDILLGN